MSFGSSIPKQFYQRSIPGFSTGHDGDTRLGNHRDNIHPRDSTRRHDNIRRRRDNTRRRNMDIQIRTRLPAAEPPLPVDNMRIRTNKPAHTNSWADKLVAHKPALAP